MNSLKIPDNGLVLKGSAGKDIGPLPPRAPPTYEEAAFFAEHRHGSRQRRASAQPTTVDAYKSVF